MESHWLAQRLRGWGQKRALIWQNQIWSYARLCDAVATWVAELDRRQIGPGDVLAIGGDYSPNVCALLLASLFNRNIIVPLAPGTSGSWDRLTQIAQVGSAFRFDEQDNGRFLDYGRTVTHPLLHQLVERQAPGLILFSSGSTGESKGSVLDLGKLLEKFRAPRGAFCTLAFLLFDHIGGMNTLFHVLCHGGTLVTTSNREPDAVCTKLAAYKVQLLPTTPTFLRMLLISDAAARHDLSALQVITYGTEPMPASTLAALHGSLPWVRLKQTYGLSEVGILPTQSRSSGSLWLKLGDAGFEHKIVGGVLWIRSPTAMLGYLNAPSPFDPEGWLNTQDAVEVDGEFIRILGRKSETINVAGEKVHPVEVENVLLQMENVKDATVSAKQNPVTGEIVAARITPFEPEDPESLKRRVRKFCQARLERYKIPAFVEIVEEAHHGQRYKKARKPAVKC